MTALLHELHRVGYFTAFDAQFSAALGRISAESDPLVLLSAAVVSRFARQGHVAVNLMRLGGRRIDTGQEESGEALFWPTGEVWLYALEKSVLVSDGSTETPLVLDSGGLLYLNRLWRYQSELAANLKMRAASRFSHTGVSDGPQVEPFSELPANSDGSLNGQASAVRAALRSGLTVIRGGPGTGKTTTVALILAALIEQSFNACQPLPRLLLTAPTGKAAARLEESLKLLKSGHGPVSPDPTISGALPEEAQTIHRAMGALGREGLAFLHGPGNPLPADVVVVDEASMIDMVLMAKLVAAIPQGARLILLGDTNQLASVDAGAVLADICEAALASRGKGLRENVVTLEQNYRFGGKSGISALAERIANGDVDRVQACLEDNRLEDVQFVPITDDTALRQAVAELARQAYLPGFAITDRLKQLNRMTRLRLLTPHRRGVAGTETLNRDIEAMLSAQGVIKGEGPWYEGRPVMVTQNDFGTGLFNGDLGIVDRAADSDIGLRVLFEGRGGETRFFSPLRLPKCETVYAMTVHKSQGSECDAVALVLPERRSAVMTRELLYTAVTRARKKVTIYGSMEVLRQTVAHRVERGSGLREALLEDDSEQPR